MTDIDAFLAESHNDILLYVIVYLVKKHIAFVYTSLRLITSAVFHSTRS